MSRRSRRFEIDDDPGDAQDDAKKATPAAKLRNALGVLADVREPGDAEAPILAAPVRRALFGWLAEIRATEELKAVGLKPRSTALLYGPPGTGKTTLAHHLAARLGIPMVIVGPETLTGKYHGESEGNVGELFGVIAKVNVPCILFMDEVEALAGHRSHNRGGGADNARTATLGVILRKVDEYSGYFIASTNRPDDLDPAFWRRLHLHIEVALPSEEERFAILRRYGLPFDFGDDELDLLVDLTEGASPALMRGLMEGLKRALVVRPKIDRPIDDVVPIAREIVSSLAPPPEMATPPLWLDGGVDRLAAMTWPPSRMES